MRTFLKSSFFTLMLAASTAQAAPTLTVGSASGQAGTTVNIPVTFNPGVDSVAGIQFSLTLPPGISTVSVTAGSIVTGAGKSVDTFKNGSTWTFIVFGLNQATMGSGTLLTAQAKIAAGTPSGTLNLPISGVSYTDPSAGIVAAGTSTGGSITVVAPITSAPVIGSAGTATGTVGTAFSYQITATNNPTSFNAAGLPAGLSVNTTTGLISGTPTAAGTSNVTLSATNSGGTGTKTLTLTINAPLPPAPVIGSAGTASGTVGTAFSYQITATNSPTSFNASGLPAGLSINTATGLISGTPTPTGTYTVTLSATNTSGTGTKTLTLTINSSITFTVTSNIQNGATLNGTLTWIATPSGTTVSRVEFFIDGLLKSIENTAPYQYNGDPDGTLNTTTLTNGSHVLGITATATNGSTAISTVTVNIANLPPAPVVGSAGTATGTVGTAFSYQITATNSPASFNAAGLPAGLSINTGTGLISGTPTTAGTYNVTLSATNSGGTGTKALTLTINTALPPAPVIGSAGTASGTVGTAFSYQITATNTPTSFNATGLPAGLSINTGTGLISGTPTTAGTYSVTLSATNSGGTGTKALTLTINTALPPAPVIGSAGTATGTTGTGFSYQITATNSPTSFNATGLPAGLSINTGTGLISGTPTTAGTVNVTLSATNSGGTGTKALTLTIKPPAPIITSPLTTAGVFNKGFSYQITASNNPTSFGAAGLPSGLSINTATGLISGSPAVQGTFSVTLTATNSSGSGSALLTLTVNAKRNPNLTGATLTPQGTSGSPALISASRAPGVTTVSAPAFLLEAEGSNFAAGDILYWNNSQVSTTLADSAHLAAFLPGSLVRAGQVTLQVKTADGEMSEPLTFLISLVPGDLAEVKVYPNPWRSDLHGYAQVIFGNLTTNTTIKIFTVSGHWVKTLPTGSGSIAWDLTNDSGDKVASGLYVYLLTTDHGQKKTGQIVIVK